MSSMAVKKKFVFSKALHSYFKFFVNEIVAKKNEKINWANEISVCKRLWKKYPDLKFWDLIKRELTFFIPSLCWLFTEKGSSFLNQKYQAYLITRLDEKKLEISSEKYGENLERSNKQTLEEFINGKNKENK